MKKIILIALIAVTLTSQAQIYREHIGFDLESIADIDIGWMIIRKHTTAPKGKQFGDGIYSANQIGYSQQFVEWMQQSYLPKGCLGDATYYQNYIPKFSGTNSLGDYWHIEANQLKYISNPVSLISSTEEYYFILPDFKYNSKGYDADDKARSNLLGFDNQKTLKGTNIFLYHPILLFKIPNTLSL